MDRHEAHQINLDAGAGKADAREVVGSTFGSGSNCRCSARARVKRLKGDSSILVLATTFPGRLRFIESRDF